MLMLLACMVGVRGVSAAESGASDIMVGKAQKLFPTTNDSLFVLDVESSQLAKTFGKSIFFYKCTFILRYLYILFYNM